MRSIGSSDSFASLGQCRISVAMPTREFNGIDRPDASFLPHCPSVRLPILAVSFYEMAA